MEANDYDYAAIVKSIQGKAFEINGLSRGKSTRHQ